MNNIISKDLEKQKNNMFIISKSYKNLVSVSNLLPNKPYDITFIDFHLAFLSDSNGIIYMNENKDYLPVSCLYYVSIRIQPGYHYDDDRDMSTPIGNYSNVPNYDWPCKDIKIKVILTMYNVDNKTFTPTERNVLIKDGAISVISHEEFQFGNGVLRDFSESHIGVL